MEPYLSEKNIPYQSLTHLKNYKRSGKRKWGPSLSNIQNLLFPLVRFIKENQIDVVHTQTNAMHNAWGWASKLAGVPHIWHQRTGGAPKGLGTLFPNKVICVSEFVRSEVKRVFPQHKLQVLHNPFNPQIYNSINRQNARKDILDELGLNEDAKLIGFVSNIHPRKRPKFFIDVATLIARRIPNSHFLLFGGDRNGYSEEVFSYAKEKNVNLIYMGFRMPPERNIAALDIHLGCSLDEGYGRSFVETGLIGVPMILVDSGSNSEIIPKSCSQLLVKIDRPDLMSEIAVNLIAGKIDADYYTDIVKEHLSMRHGIENYINSMVTIYEDLLIDYN